MFVVVWIFIALAVCFPGCARQKHVQRADRAAYGAIGQKTSHTPWRPPAGYNVLPDPRARFYDPTCPVDPRLPMPAPVLYGYQIPDLVTQPDGGSPVRRLSYEAPAGDDSATQRSLDESAWNGLPEACVSRMLEFDSVQQEFRATFPDASVGDLLASGRRLHLPAIVELALINSREYQTQKEALYQVALRLTLERFAYDLQFFPRGNGASVNYRHSRDGGATVNTLGIPSAVGVQKVTRHGADLLAQFANDIVLTFNGPTGFSSRIGSELLFQVTQTIFQRDVIFESLTQAERDLVYAARSFARFRKEFFVRFARDYYSLLLSYRSVEINSFDYFSNYREFRKGEATFLAGKVSRIQVDQFEQNALRSRRNLVRTCNSLETALDNLKLRIGVPPEMPLNIDLSELEALTRADSLAATIQKSVRTRQNLKRELGRNDKSLAVQLNLAKLLATNLREVLALQSTQRAAPPTGSGIEEVEVPAPDDGGPNRKAAPEQLTRLLHELDTLEALLKVEFNDQVLASDIKIQPPVAPLRLFQRRIEVARSLLAAKRLLLQTPPQNASDGAVPSVPTPDAGALAQVAAAEQKIERLAEELNRAIREQDVDAIDAAVGASEPLLVEVRQLVMLAPGAYSVARLNEELAPELTKLFQLAERLLDSSAGPLPEVDIQLNEAMLTAATQRFELANTREQLADTWRQIKLRGDDLRAIAGWSFQQSIRTPSNRNRPFSFSFDDSDTRLSFAFDAPLNRFRERNNFRLALITYNQQLRRLLQTEDEIKLAIRNNLRSLDLDRNQYDIAVASAALAAERVYSTRLRFDQGNGTARDFLEAQQAYTESLSAVASEHIGFLVDRMQLFLELEQLEVNELGFWPDLYNPDAPVLVRTEMPHYGMSIYGDLPFVKYSACIRRMLHIPAGQPRIELPLEESVDGGSRDEEATMGIDNRLESIETPPPSGSVNKEAVKLPALK